MKEFNYLKEKARMLKALGHTGTEWCNTDCNADCKKCPLSHRNNRSHSGCTLFEINCPDEATEIVRKWAEEHPARTRKDVLFERLPGVRCDKNGTPQACAYYLGFVDKGEHYEECGSDTMSCARCWNTEVEE